MKKVLITLAAIARGLLEPRFCGGTRADRRLYTVTEHCVRGSYAIEPALAPAFLLHDAHEWPFRDLAPAAKRHPAMRGYRLGCRRFQRVVNARFGLAPDADRDPRVKAVDLTMLATEQRDLMGPAPAKWGALPPPLPDPIVPWDAAAAEARFLARAAELGLR